MRNLHAIIIAGAEAYIWGYAYGRNGRPLGAGTGNQGIWRGGVVSHAYRIRRGHPRPSLEDIAANPGIWRDSRAYWHPWTANDLTAEERLTPVCGRIRSQSRDPRFNTSEQTNWNPINRCPECERLMPTTTTVRQLREADPWHMLSRHERIGGPDPVSGL